MKEYMEDKKVSNLLPKVLCSAIEEAHNNRTLNRSKEKSKSSQEWNDHYDYSDHNDTGYSVWSDVV